MKELDSYRDTVDLWGGIEKETDDLLEMAKLVEESEDKKENKKLSKEIENKVREIIKKFLKNEFQALMDGKYDEASAIVAIHAGAGGVDAQDWAEMLLRMYLRWIEKKGYEADVIDLQPGEEAGLKNATLIVTGEHAFGYLKAENGIHRLIRISPFDTGKRRHTSFASVFVYPEIDEKIEVTINEEDLRIDTYRSSGAGGQHVNVTDSAVRITHLPTGIVAQCQNERSQHKNKATAMKILRSRLYEREQEEQAKKMENIQGEKKEIAWGNQIRTYTLQPYQMVKDHRTNLEVGNVDAVLDGSLDQFIEAYLLQKVE